MKKPKKVLVFGTFDGIHPGHIHFLTEAKKLGDLFISVASDESLEFRKLHKATKKAEARLKDIISLGIAKGATIGDRVLGNWTDVKSVKPDIIALGYDQKGLEMALKKFKKEIGVDFVIKKFLHTNQENIIQAFSIKTKLVHTAQFLKSKLAQL